MSTQLAKTDHKRDIRALIQSDATKQQLAMVLPKHLTADRMARVACTAVLKTPKLLDCKPESLLSALMLCSQAGLEPDGRNAHLIPYGDQVQVIFDYKGLVALAERNGVECIYADKVCEEDVFNYEVVDGEKKLAHKVNWRQPRGDAYAYYASCRRNGRLDIEVMTKHDVDAIRKRSRASGSGPWVTDYDEMAKKTVLRRMSKRWDLSPEIADVINADADTPAFGKAQVFTEPKPAKLFAPSVPTAPVEPPTDDVPMGDEIPPAAEPEPPNNDGEKSSPQNDLEHTMSSSGVAFDDFRDFVRVKGIAKDADSWGSWAEVPTKVCETLAASPKTQAECIRKFGKVQSSAAEQA